MADKVTIADVARVAGVSRQTVSNALNTPEVVRPETRQRVLEVVEELGYRVNFAARQMRTGRSKLIAIRIDPAGDGVNGSVFDRFLHGLTESAAGAGYRLLLYTAADDQKEIAAFQDLLGAYEPDGFVLTSTHHKDARTSWLLERGLPFVTFGRPWSEPADVHPWVDVDGSAGTEAATEHLLAAGHRRIAFIGWPSGSGVGDDRREGWRRALAGAGLDPAGLSRETPDGIADGEAAARDLLTADPDITALVCASDSLALGALHVARSPNPAWHAEAYRRIAVTGFDDTPVAKAIGLTSVHQPLTDAAARCMDLLGRALDGTPPGNLLLPPSLVVRQSA
ncbi:alanine racemase [Acrocarpospora phusangensis]|uniref:Alanine racemase n=1 Tax=Acrocarpospora phusangensis TaxID=1070424 RepID=A0A919UQK2_9ACTN|nr:LacI family DNA-binding transcriptional regulator [Acrocarpospora phusangensis]GIH24650.1 alanine racemase [Acrocarpospora phusangensis]